MSRKLSASGFLAGALLLGLAAPAAWAADSGDGKWHGEVMPYVWGVGIDGKIRVDDQTTHVSYSLSDVIDSLDWSAELLASANNGRWGFFGQVDYMVMDNFDTPPNLDVTLDAYITTLAVGRIFHGKKDRTYEVMAGVRKTGFDAKAKTPLATKKTSPDVVDYVLIFRPDIPLSERWKFNPLLSIGTGDSDYVWELWPQFQVSFSDRWAARIGYRNLHYKLDQQDNTDIDLDFRGVMAGFGVTW